MKISHIIILVALAIFVVGLGVNLSGSVSIYTDFSTAKKSQEKVHIVGTWVDRDLATYEVNQDLFRFAMMDSLDQKEIVHFYDPKPINFEQAEKVVVIGGYQGDKFVADKIVTKCPSKYEPTDITAGEPDM